MLCVINQFWNDNKTGHDLLNIFAINVGYCIINTKISCKMLWKSQVKKC